MVETVVTEGEIFLNGKRYKLRGNTPIQRTIQTREASQQRVTTVRWDDLSGGLGIERIKTAEDFHRIFKGTCQVVYKGHIVLPPLRIETTGTGLSGVTTVIGELAGSIYIATGGGVDVRKYTPDSWGSSLATLAAAATDVLNFTLVGTEYLAFAHTGGYTYTLNGTAYTADTTYATKFLVFWDGRLWGISAAGQLWFSSTIGTETTDALLDLPSGYVQGLFIGPDAAGEPIIYAATQEGLYAHDAPNARFVKTGFSIPRNTNAGLGACTWNGLIYFSVGASVYEYNPQTALARPMGPDRDDGLPYSEYGTSVVIEKLIPTHLWLMAQQQSGDSAMLVYNGRGWHDFDHQGATGGSPITTYTWSRASTAHGAYRLWVSFLDPVGGATHVVSYYALPTENVSPAQQTTLTYGNTSTGQGELYFPVFDAGETNVSKLAVRLLVETTNPTTAETIVVYASIDGGARTQLGSTITAGGVTEFLFPNSTTPTGTAFKTIQFSFDFDRSATNTRTPDILSVTFEYRRKLTPKYGFTIELDLQDDVAGASPRDQVANLITVVESNPFVEFTYRDDSTGAQTYYVDVVEATNLEHSAANWTGICRVNMIEG